MFLGICCFLVNLLAPSTKPNNQPSRGKDNGPLIGSMNYEELLAEGDPMARWDPPIDEWTACPCVIPVEPQLILKVHNGGITSVNVRVEILCVFFSLSVVFLNKIEKKVVTKVGHDMLYL